MALGTLLSLASNKKAWGLVWVFLKQPWYFIPTFLATYHSVRLSDKHFGKAHHTNSPANAFRHALWNYLIAKKAYWWHRNPDDALAWAKKITDYHERMMPNEALAQAMDLHNNAVGREIFRADTHQNTNIVSLLLEKSKHSLWIASLEAIPEDRTTLVHIEA
ncbi:MAG: hypothetical protein OIF50_10830 [Flavobacteriaceae bacterium]|nr:hypothetical protein [Flavobacteriaceae bacterium]